MRNLVDRPVDLSDSLPPLYTASTGRDSTLIFESRFESGNLSRAVKLGPKEYNLLLANDTNSRGNTQWFFFRVTNTFKRSAVRFHLINLRKKDSLFNHGMRVLVYSKKHFKETGEGWHRDGSDIAYYANGIPRGNRNNTKYYSLSFTHTFEYSADTVYFAYSVPYTYTQL